MAAVFKEPPFENSVVNAEHIFCRTSYGVESS